MSSPVNSALFLESTEALISFFGRSYGEAFVGAQAFERDYIARADALLVVEDELIAGGALLMRKTRITAIGTNPTTVSRPVSMALLLEVTEKEFPSSWISIGEKYPRMVHAVASAGMSAISDFGYVQEKLEMFGELDIHETRKVGAVIQLRKHDSTHGPGYWQQAWGWQ